MRLRVPGGQVTAAALRALIDVAERHGDGRVRVTSRANLQVRGLPASDDGKTLPDQVLVDLEGTGLLPSRAHDLARNVLASPCTGRAGGLADLRPIVAELDRHILADPTLATLPGRFLFVLDDGRGDVVSRSCDLGIVALSSSEGQLRVGAGWSDRVRLDQSVAALVELAAHFLMRRGTGPRAAWHVAELGASFARAESPDPRVPAAVPPLPYGCVPGGNHVPVPAAGLDRDAIIRLTAAAPDLVVTPWRGVLIPEET